MTLSWSWHDTCTIERPTQAVNSHTGEPEGEPDWSSPDQTSTECSIQPRSSVDAEGGAVVVGDWIGYLPADADLRGDDRISWRGRLLAVDGDVAPIVFNGAVHHLEVPLKAWGAS